MTEVTRGGLKGFGQYTAEAIKNPGKINAIGLNVCYFLVSVLAAVL